MAGYQSLILISFLALLSLTTAGAVVPHKVVFPRKLPYPHPNNPVARRVVQPSHLYSRSGLPTQVLETRAEPDATFDINWGVQNEPLFSAKFGAGIDGIPVGIPGVTVGVAGDVSLALECIDCRTFGSIIADLNDENPFNLSTSLTFKNVGVYMEFGMELAGQGTFTIGLGKAAIGKPKLTTGQVFTAGFNVGLELVLQVTGDVKAAGGFYLSIPDGQQVGLGIDVDVDLAKSPVPKFKGDVNAFPKVDFGLVPLKMSNASVNITAALRLKAEVGLAGELPIPPATIKANAAAGAHVTLVEVKLGAVRTVPGNTTNPEPVCKNALFVQVESGAGAFAEAGVEIENIKSASVGPSVSTLFFRAGKTTCLASASPSFVSTTIKTIGASTTGAAGACPTAMVTETKNATTTYSCTRCLVASINCPPSLTQVVVATDVAQVVQTRCPVNVTTSKASGTPTTTAVRIAPGQSAPATTLPPVVTSELIRLSPVPSPVATTAKPVSGNFTIPKNATTITGVFLPITVPPPPPPATTLAAGGGSGEGGIFRSGAAGSMAKEHASSLALVFGFMIAAFAL